ncbi:MAG: lysylphosphatidylglycerol synthase transmembrane domain-containing protein [Solirubrobacteraceae bacterium]
MRRRPPARSPAGGGAPGGSAAGGAPAGDATAGDATAGGATAARSAANGLASGNDERSPLGRALSRRRLAFAAILILASLAGLYLLLPKLAGLNQTWGRLQHGDPAWLGVAGGAELLSIAGYIVLFRTVFGRGMERLDWRASVQIPLAGIAAIRLLAAAGAGGVAVTAWALGRAGMEARVIACRMVANLILQYAVYLAALVLFGLGLAAGILPGHGPFELTVLPALLSLAAAGAVLGAMAVPADAERRLRRISSGPRWWRRVVERVAAAPEALGAGARTAVALLRERRPGLLGAVAYWGFDIAALGCSFRAFGGHPAVAVLVLCYFLGTLGSLLPLPGGIGGVEGAMIGSFVAFGLPAGQAVIAVLAYRAISFWLPTLPGIAGYLALRRTVRRWDALGSSVGSPAAAPAAPAAEV